MPAATRPDADPWARRNHKVLGALAPVLVATGVLGFVLPARVSLMSGATGYNVFHIVAGLVGGALCMGRRPRAEAGFNLGFGLIDLYQALAGVTGLFPARLFGLRPADHVVHVLLGGLLVALGAKGTRVPALTPASERRS